MDTLTLHGANRVLERGVSLEAIQMISDQRETLSKARDLITPALTTNKLLKFRYQGRQYTATPSRISTVLKIGSNTFVIGMDSGNNYPTIVTAWN